MKCTFCKTVISVDEILAFPEKDGKHVITCDECSTQWIIVVVSFTDKYFSSLCKKMFISINFLYSSFNCS